MSVRSIDRPPMTDADDTSRETGPSWRRRLVPVMVVLLLGQMATAMLLSAAKDAPTFDEVGHLASGIAYTKLHDLNFNVDHPPFVQLLSSLPYRFLDINLPPGPSEVDRETRGEVFTREAEALYGNRLLYESGNDPGRVLWLSRLPLIFLTLLFALVVFGFTRDLFGNAGAVLALAVATLTPDLIAHGRLVNTDVAVSGATLATVWFLWRAAHRDPRWLAAAGVAFGVALASKYSALIVLLPIVALTAFAAWLRGGPGRTRAIRAIVWILVTQALALAVVWGTYLLADPQLRYERPNVRAAAASGPLASIADRLPVPEPYRVGVRFRIDDESAGRVGYLFGEVYRQGKIIFYPALLAMKTPIGILLMWAAGVIAILASGNRKNLLLFLLVPPLFYLLIAMMSTINIGARHVLVVPLFLAVATGAIATVRVRGRAVVATILTLAAAVSAWRVFPSYLAYANEAFGGPGRLYRHVADSNVDWGQDLRRLAEWMRKNHPGERVAILYVGTPRIAHYGFDASNSWDLEVERPEHVEGFVAVSATYYSLFTARAGDRDKVVVHAFGTEESLGTSDLRSYLQSIGVVGDPITTIGHSILIFRGR